MPVLVVFPNSYYVAMSNLAVHVLYGALNAIPGVTCDRFFLDGETDGLSLEGALNLRSFEIIFFSLSFELDYPNIPRILDMARIARRASERTGGDPIVAAGGICVTANPEPLHGFFDLFLLGDGEAIIPPFMDRYLQCRGKTREMVVEELGRFPWVYNPAKLAVSYGRDGTPAGFDPADFSVTTFRYRGAPLAASALIAGETEFAHMFLMEGTRGCPSRCPFCLLGTTQPCTHDPLPLPDEPVTDIGLIGGGVSFHPRLEAFIREMKEQGKRVHLPSLRIDEVSLAVVELMKDDIKTLTFGVEAGTERLRSLVGKELSDADLFERIEAILAVKPFNLKLYFMLGLPGETRDDVEAVVEMVKHVKHLMVKQGAPRGFVGSVTVHASPFVPKAATPFQWLAMAEEGELKEKITLLRRSLAKVENTYFTHESVKFSLLQGILSRGDRRVMDVIERLASGENLGKIAKESPINLSFYIHRERGADELMPWDFIRGEATRETLRRRLTRALAPLSGHPVD